MTTMEKLGWLAIILALLIAVGTTIMIPIYNKAVEQKNEIEKFDLTLPSGLLDTKYEFAMKNYRDNNKLLNEHIAYTA